MQGWNKNAGQSAVRITQQTLSRVAPILEAGSPAMQQRRAGISGDGSILVKTVVSNPHIGSADGGRDSKGMTTFLLNLGRKRCHIYVAHYC